MNTLTDRVAALLEALRGQWVDGRTLADVGGYAAWRSRVSDCRKRGLVVENRWRTVQTATGRYRVSEYRVPA